MLPRVERRGSVVVCEDDAATLELLCDHLEADCYTALPAPSAGDALRLCHFKSPDLLLLDLRLPDASGLDVLREIRASEGAIGRYDPLLPVIVLSGRGTAADRLRGLAAGADDYVPKPFDFSEVSARIGAVLRRRDGRRLGPRLVGDLFIDTATREVRVGERAVRLAGKEYALLCALAAEPRRVFTKQELLRDVWGFQSLGNTRTLDSHASRLRRKLDPESARYVVNVWGVGYRLIAGCGVLPELSAVTSAGWPVGLSLAVVVAGERFRASRRRAALNRALHELRRPLQALSLVSAQLDSPLAGPRTAVITRETVDAALAALADLDREVNRLPIEPSPRPVSASGLVHSSVERWRPTAARRGRSLTVKCDVGPAMVLVDPRRIEAALDNLIANALEHGTLSVVVTARVGPRGVRISVADGGSGRRRPRPRRDPRRGHGLRVVGEVARQHDGRFLINHSESGTEAVLELPLAGPTAVEAGKPAA